MLFLIFVSVACTWKSEQSLVGRFGKLCSTVICHHLQARKKKKNRFLVIWMKVHGRTFYK